MVPEKQTIIKLLSVLFPKSKIYLFGSRARGTYKVTSDIDLAIDIGKPISDLDLVKAHNIIDALNIPQKVDLVDLHSIPESMKDIILKEGILWKS
jgi:uncharacterized protein